MISYNSYSQKVAVPLSFVSGKNENVNSMLLSTRIEQNISNYRGFDTLKYEFWGIRFSRVNNYKTKLTSFVGIDKAGLKHIIVDVNFNEDFSDDQEYVFNPIGPISNPIISLNYKEIVNEYAYRELEIEPYPSNLSTSYIQDSTGKIISTTKDIADEKLNFRFKGRGYLKGTIQNAGKNLEVYIHMSFWNSYEIVLTEKGTQPKERFIYSNKDFLLIGKDLYRTDSVKNNNLYLTWVEKAQHMYGALNTLAPDFQEVELFKNKILSLKQYKGEYLIIDFWGSWCVPCIKALPTLVKLFNKYSRVGVKVLSIAADRPQDLDKLKSIIKEQKLNWDHLIVNRNGFHPIIKNYRIQSYPTTLLINPKGKIVVREIGEKALDSIDMYLEKHMTASKKPR